MSIDRFQSEESRSTGPAPAASGSKLPYLLAAALMLAGVALAMLPVLAPQHAWAVRSAARYGLTSAPLLLASCVLFGVALSLRSGRTPQPEPRGEDHDLLLDQVASELAALRGGLQELRVEFVYVKDAQQTLLEALSERGDTSQAEAQQSAMFRLAASLDQVGAKIEQRLAASESAMQGLLGELGAGITATQQRLAEIATAPRATARGAAAAERWVDADGADPALAETAAWPGYRDRSGLGLLDTLDDPAHAAQAAAAQAAGAPAAAASAPVPAQPAPQEAAPSPHGRILRNDRPRAPQADEPAAPLPQAAVDAPIEGKIALLRSLLADGRVRDVLETMRRGG